MSAPAFANATPSTRTSSTAVQWDARHPRTRAVFAMVLRLPADAPLGVNGLGCELAPSAYLPPFVDARVLVTR
jgi:hypothetical protein